MAPKMKFGIVPITEIVCCTALEPAGPVNANDAGFACTAGRVVNTSRILFE
jgi:hypothetical protein